MVRFYYTINRQAFICLLLTAFLSGENYHDSGPGTLRSQYFLLQVHEMDHSISLEIFCFSTLKTHFKDCSGFSLTVATEQIINSLKNRLETKALFSYKGRSSLVRPLYRRCSSGKREIMCI